MLKRFGIGLVALLTVLALERPAHAWIDCKWSIGASWHWQSGNNCWGWGGWSNGPGGPSQYCAPGVFGAFPAPYAPPPAPPGLPPPPIPAYSGVPTPGMAQPGVTPALPTSRAPGLQTQFGTIPNWYPGQNVFQAVSQQPSYAPPAYDYSGYNYSGSYSVPSYWYGR